MQNLSKRTQYCLRALYALARKHGEGPVLIMELAEEEVIPKRFLEQILLSLKRSGLVLSKKGKGGGYYLAQPPDQITLANVIRLVEGPWLLFLARAKLVSGNVKNASMSKPAERRSSCARSA